MDKSTIIFIVTLVIAFTFLRWLIAPIPHSVAGEFNLPDPESQSQDEGSHNPRRSTRPISDSMIEVVKAIGPQLSNAQIVYSLESMGSVEATVEQFMENGNLPYPPGDEPRRESNDETNHQDPQASSRAQTLLEKYAVEEDDLNEEENLPEGKWGKDKQERLKFLQKRKEQMILRARRRMKESLGNEVTGDLLTDKS